MMVGLWIYFPFGLVSVLRYLVSLNLMIEHRLTLLFVREEKR